LVEFDVHIRAAVEAMARVLPWPLSDMTYKGDLSLDENFVFKAAVISCC
jgi:hypothetical protein